MKKINKLGIVLSGLLLALCCFTISCEDDSEVFTVSETTPVILSELTITLIELDQNNPGNPAITFNWNEADYGEPAAENYTVQVAAEEAFNTPVDAITVSGELSATLSVNELNTVAGGAGLPPFQQNTLYARVVTSLGTQNGLPVASNVINFDVIPFFNYAFDDYYLVGNGTSPDWNNNNNNPPLFRSADNSDFYTYTGFFTKGGGGNDDGRFKVLETRGLWQPQWGVTADEGSDDIITSGGIAGNPGTQDGDPGRFGVEADGFYTFSVNFKDRTFTIETFDATGASDFTSMTLQGNGLADGDVEMNQLTFDSHIWYINSVTLKPGSLNFLTNTGASWAGSTEFSGVATEGGMSIPVVVEDQYEVWFNDLTGDYIMIPLNL